MEPRTPVDREEDGDERTEKMIFVESISRLLAQPSERALGAVKRATKALLQKKEKGSPRLVVLSLAKVYLNLLPSYNIHLSAFKYNTRSKATNYEYSLAQEWRGYLKMLTRSRTDESYEAATILLPQTVLFNKSSKLIGKVVKGTAIKGRLGQKCTKTLKTIFKCDKGNRIIKILEVVNQMNLQKVSKKAIKALLSISDEVLAKPERLVRLRPEEMRKLTTEEKAIQKEAQLHSLPDELRAWKGINERLLRTYLLILTQRSIDRYWFVIPELSRLKIPGNLHEGIFTVLTEKIDYLKANLTPHRVVILVECYTAIYKIFGAKLEFAFQQEDLKRIPLDIWVEIDNKEMKRVYSCLQSIEKHQGHPDLIKLLIRRGMYRIDPNLSEIVRYLMPVGGPKYLESYAMDGFWEFSLLRRPRSIK
ncbi:hypothetical protein NEHOM01_1628 [Nematocida homosporus]|uniref:uncharacterized protein n=1 Tax=Nematocida homosporus TaxID=1912981 RepID=UPI002220512E|nr:uncharacterized protein NEHOM01_1628 [Nematocida homosporus]KAI5186675.1 hypothetical protein NEHOM01_1628 [Nematocida homosporus]